MLLIPDASPYLPETNGKVREGGEWKGGFELFEEWERT
jgi:hypothetical protein